MGALTDDCAPVPNGEPRTRTIRRAKRLAQNDLRPLEEGPDIGGRLHRRVISDGMAPSIRGCREQASGRAGCGTLHRHRPCATYGRAAPSLPMSSAFRRLLLAVAALVAAPLAAQVPAARVTPGISVLIRDSLHLIRGKRVGLITNHTGRDAAGASSIDLIAHAPGVTLVALFGPEHGLRGIAEAGEHVASTVDSATGVPIFSLYGATNAPTAEMLKNVDVLLYDIQDVATRTYTFVWTMALSAAAAGKRGIPFIVCDRPVPTRGDVVEGNILDTAYRSFVGQYPVPLRYGLTPGEMLRHLVRTKQVRVLATVIPMQGWTRTMWYDQTGLPWIAPSPNLRTLDAALLYAGTVLVEGSNLSEGRGTDAPFQLVGAPWLTDAGAIARILTRLPRYTRGASFDSVSRTIAAGQKFAGQTIPMVRITVTDRDSISAVRLGAALLSVIHARHPGELVWRDAFLDKLAGGSALRQALNGTISGTGTLLATWRTQAAAFERDTRVDRLYR